MLNGIDRERRPRRMKWHYASFLAGLVLLGAGCGDAFASAPGSPSIDAGDIPQAEQFLDAFLSGGPAALESAVSASIPADAVAPNQSLDDLLAAQAEMTALNYEVHEYSCSAVSEDLVECNFLGDDDASRLLGHLRPIEYRSAHTTEKLRRILEHRNPQGYWLSFSNDELNGIEYFATPQAGYLSWVDWVFAGNASVSFDSCQYGPEPDPGLCAEALIQSVREYVGSTQ